MTFKVKDGVVVGSTTALDANGKLATGFSTARTIALSGDVTGSTTFDGTANITTTTTLANSGVTAGTYSSVTVDAKGRVTGGTNPGYLTSYTETDTLATVTARGATTSTNTTYNGNLTANSTFTAGALSVKTFDIGVSSTVYWTITQPDGTAIASGDIYRISMSTSGTGTDTGEVYLLSNPDSLGWQIKLVSSTGRNSNYPYVFLDAGVPKIKTDHTSTYTVRTIIEKFAFNNTGSLTTSLGLEAYFSVDQGTPKFRGTWNGTDYNVWHSGNLTNLNQLTNGPGYLTGTKVDSFNTRTGAVTLTSTDVTTALGFTPYNSTNPNGYTSNTGTVTSVSGTGSYGGLTLTGTVTSSGSLTLGGTPTGTWPISVSGNAATLGGYSLAQTIPYHSGSDFVNGTLVTTSIPATAANGASFVIEVTGKGYGADVINLMAEGYLYNSTIINYDAIDIGGGFSTNLYMIENGGYLCFWWARMSYWQSFSVKVRDAAGSSANTVTNITDVVLPAYTKGVIVTPKKVLNSSNYNSYSPTLTGTGASGTWGISISGNAATVSSITSSQVTTALGYTPYNSTNPNGYITSSGSITGSSGSVSGLTLTSSANGINPDNVTQNQLGYNTSVSLFGQTDGGLYSSAHSSSWIHQIYGDFRTGQIAIRGKNSGTWQAWRTVLDSSNYTSYSPSLTGSGASGSWGISITGSSASCTGNSATATTATNVTGGYAQGSYLGVQQTNGAGQGLSLYNGYTTGQPSFGIMFATTANFGTHGSVSADWATYFTMDSTANRGWVFRNTTSGNVASINNSGTAVFNGNVTAYSDETLKKDWNNLPVDFIERLSKVKSGSYTRIDSGERQVGVSAQSLQPLLPEAILEGEKLSVAYGNAAMVSAVELAKKVVEQEKRIEQLESLVSQLMQKLA